MSPRMETAKTAQRNRELCMIIQGLKEGNVERAKNQIVEENENLIRRFVMYHFKKELPPDLLNEALQEARFGLYIAATKYDTTRSIVFSTYAFWWMRQRVTKLQQHLMSITYIPTHIYDKLYREMKNQKVKDIVSLNEDLVDDPKLKEEIKAVKQAFDITSLDKEYNQNDNKKESSLKDTIKDESADVSEFAMDNVLKSDISAALKHLDEDEAELVRRKYGVDGYNVMTRMEIMNLMQLDAYGIKALEKKALKKLAKHLKNYKDW